MSARVKIFVFADALGWELVQRYDFGADLLPFRAKVRTQLGYSSTAVPTILSGEPPTRHGHFSFFFYDRDNRSPFKIFKYLHWMLHPSLVFDNHRVRHRLSVWLKKRLGFTGYFNLYRVPYDRLPRLDYCEKNDIFAPGGLGGVDNLYDALSKKGVKFYISDWRKGDRANLDEARETLAKGEHDFYFIYTAGLDAMLHFHVGDDATVSRKFAEFAAELAQLKAAATASGRESDLFCISDHGMTPLAGTADLRIILESGPWEWGRDFIACYDSTMVRVWFLREECRRDLMERLEDAPGHWLSAEEKQNFNVDFAQGRYGEEIFLADPGVQIAPSDMGGRAIPGMHGYSPEHQDSDACLMAEREPSFVPRNIAQFFDLMVGEATE